MLTRNVERNDVLKSSDVITERRPKAEVGGDAATRTKAVGMQMRKQLRAGQAIKVADLGKPDLVQRDDNVTLIYEATGLYLTVRGKAMDNGTDGDVVNVLNLQSKRTVSGVVIGRGQGRDFGRHPRGFPLSPMPKPPPPFQSPTAITRQCLQKPSNVDVVQVQYQSLRVDGQSDDHRRSHRRLFIDRSSFQIG